MSKNMDNPFLNPELMHPELSAQISEAETWQEENSISDAGIATEGLAKTIQGEVGLTAPEWVKPELVETYENITDQAESSRQAANKLIDDLNNLPGRAEKREQIDSREFSTLLARKMQEWHDNGSLDWAKKYIDDKGSPNRVACEMILVCSPKIEMNGADLYGLAEKLALEKENGRVSQHGETTRQFIQQFNSDELTTRTDFAIQEDTSAEQELQMVLLPSMMGNFVRTHERDTYRREQFSKQPNLSKPSVLDAMGYIYALRTKGEDLDGIFAYANSHMEDFPAKLHKGTSIFMRWHTCTPSLGYMNGYFHLDPRPTDQADSVRLAVT